MKYKYTVISGDLYLALTSELEKKIVRADVTISESVFISQKSTFKTF